jgi:hypothetical protein
MRCVVLLVVVAVSLAHCGGTNATYDARLKFRTDQSYLEKIAALAAPGAVLAALSALFFPVFAALRLCCGTCGGRHPTVVYQSGQRGLTAMFLYSLLAIATGAAFLGYAGNRDFGKGMAGFSSGVASTIRNYTAVSDGVDSSLTGLGQPPLLGPSDRFKVSVFANETDKIADRLRDFERARSAAVYAIFSVALVAVVVALLGGLVRVGGLLWLAFFFFWASLILVWILFAIHLPLNTAFDDLCHDTLLISLKPTMPNPISDATLPCPTSPLGDVRQSLLTGLMATAYLPAAANPSIWPDKAAAPVPESLLVSPTSADELARLLLVADSIAANTTAGPAPRVKAVVDGLRAAVKGFGFLDSYEKCTVFSTFLDVVINQPICDPGRESLRQSTIKLAFASGAQGCALILATYFLIAAIKRFSRQTRGPHGGPIVRDHTGKAFVEQSTMLPLLPPGQHGAPQQRQEEEEDDEEGDAPSSAGYAQPRKRNKNKRDLEEGYGYGSGSESYRQASSGGQDYSAYASNRSSQSNTATDNDQDNDDESYNEESS